jgi:hypothetical protein
MTQADSGMSACIASEKKGFVKSPRAVEYLVFGPDSPLPEVWRVFLFIKYRIQNNKSKGQSERISREYIIAQTGIWPNNFSRIIKKLIDENLIEVTSRNSDGVATYFLSRSYFGNEVVAFDGKRKHVSVPAEAAEQDVDKSCGQNVDNIKMMSESESQHQNDVSQHQIDEGMGITRVPFPKVLNSFRARGGGGGGFESFGEKKPKTNAHLYGLTDAEYRKQTRKWLAETNAEIEFGVWWEEKLRSEKS